MKKQKVKFPFVNIQAKYPLSRSKRSLLYFAFVVIQNECSTSLTEKIDFAFMWQCCIGEYIK